MVQSTPEFLGPYRVVRLLGRGGMGTVYEAVHETSQERVAVKLISEELAREPRFQRRFEAEIQTMLRLKHPNIVRLIGIGDHLSLPFYSMEFIDGINLHQMLKLERRVAWEVVLDWAIEIASALKQSHDFGIIHRDLKPANLMLTPQNTIKLLDFGISRLFGNINATIPGSTIGTADFMPPEQAEGAVATPRSDLYALGAICYACMSGRAPFTGNSVPEILFNVRYGIYTPLSHLVPEVPEEFCKLVDELLSREEAKRPATAYLTMNRLLAMRAGLRRREQQKHESQADNSSEQISKGHSGEEQTSIGIDAIPSIADLSDSPYHDATRIEPSGESGRKNSGPVKAEHVVGEPKSDKLAKDQTAAEEATREHITGGSLVNHASAPGISTERGSSFSEVTDKDRARAMTFDLPDPVIRDRERWKEIIWIAAALAACAGAFYYFSRPVNPDQLYAPILAAMTNGDETRLLELEEQITDFQKKHPDDARISQIESAADQVAYLKQLRFLQRRASGGDLGQEAIVSALRDIVRRSQTDPVRSILKLDALLNAYPDDLLTQDEQGWMNFAKRLRRELDSKRDAESDRVKYTQLENHYSRIIGTELSVDRERALRGIIELYGQEPWAVAIVSKAAEELKNLMP